MPENPDAKLKTIPSLPSTLQRVLADFDEKLEKRDFDKNDANLPDPEKIKTFIESALTESLKEAFADGRADMKAECIAAVEKLKVSDRNNPKSIRVAAALGKEQTRKGPIACARSDGYEVATSEIIAALQAIEEKRKAFMAEK